MGLGVGAAELHVKHAVNVGQRLGVRHGVGILHQRRRLIAQRDHLVLPRLAHQRAAVAGAGEIPHQHQRRHRAHRQRAQQLTGAEQRQQHRDGGQIVDALAAPRRRQRAQNHDSGQLLFVQLRAAQVHGRQHEHQKQLGPRRPGRAEGLLGVHQHRRQQKRQVDQCKPRRAHRAGQPLFGQVLRRGRKAAHNAADEQVLHQHDAAGHRHKHQRQNKRAAGQKVLPRVGLQRPRQIQHGQVIIAPDAGPDDEQDDQIHRQIRQRPGHPPPGKFVPGAQLPHQRHRAVHQPERQHQKQRLVDKKRRCAPVIAEEQPVRSQRQGAPQHRSRQLRRRSLFCRCFHSYSFRSARQNRPY